MLASICLFAQTDSNTTDPETNSSVQFQPDNVQKNHSVTHVILYYFPNRLLDLSDIITAEASAGQGAFFDLTLTKWTQFAGEFGNFNFVEKGYNRQNGGGQSTGNISSFVCMENGDWKVDNTWGSVRPYEINDVVDGMALAVPSSEPYKNGILDFWRIGFHLGFFAGIGMDVHPVAVANFLTGFFFVRLTDTQDI